MSASLLWSFDLFFNNSTSNLTNSNPWFSSFWSVKFDSIDMITNIFTSIFSQASLYNPPLWTIQMELYGSMLVYLFLIFIGGTKYRIIISIILTLIFQDSLYQGFWIGLLIADIIKNYSLWRPFKYIVIYYPALILFFYISSYPNYANQDFLKETVYSFLPDDQGFGGGYPMLSATLIFILVISNNRFKKFLSQPLLQFFGHISYSLYITHFLILGSFSSWFFLILNRSIGYNISFIIVFFLGLTLTILASCITTKYIDTPSIRLANFIGNKIINLKPTRQLKKQ
ncbi:MAG: acyltransferase family protein [Gammaproteobacteria bacterium]|nr:acyltransferase family protein [Gammaproteobacteria bacterium]